MVSVLFNEPKLLKRDLTGRFRWLDFVSVLFNEPKLLKFFEHNLHFLSITCFSALQRAEIAEIGLLLNAGVRSVGFSALQRAEIAEIKCA